MKILFLSFINNYVLNRQTINKKKHKTMNQYSKILKHLKI